MTGAIGFEGLQEPEETTGSLAALTAALVERTKGFRKATIAAAATQAEEYRSAVLDALAHEFKTPLATILAAAGGIREAGPLGPEQQDMAETIESEAVRLSSLTSRLLRTVRLDREEIKPRLEVIDLESLAAQLASQYLERSPDRRILLQNPYDRLEVLADPQLLRIALSQLVENACKYSVPGSDVTIGLDRQGDSIAVKISNTGSSIPYNERTRIFERFYRGSDASRSTSGSGLGLYVARKIAIAHGGALELEVEDRAKVTFSLKIPIGKEAANRVVAAK
jgi:two-component system sensor histidine kinase KdpD